MRVKTHEHISSSDNDKLLEASIYVKSSLEVIVEGTDSDTQTTEALSGIKLFLKRLTDGAILEGTTNSSGTFRFTENLFAGRYELTANDTTGKYSNAEKEIIIKRDMVDPVNIKMYTPYITQASVEFVDGSTSEPCTNIEVKLTNSTLDYSKKFITDAEGKIYIDCLPEGIYKIIFEGNEIYKPYENPFNFTKNDKNKIVHLNNTIIDSYSFIINDEDTGEAVIGATAILTDIYGNSDEVEVDEITQEATFYNLLQGKYSLNIHCTGYYSYKNDNILISDEGEQTIILSKSSVDNKLIEVISSSNHLPIKYASVKLVSALGGKVISGYTNDNGVFETGKLGKGKYNCTISNDNYKTYNQIIQINNNDMLTIELEDSIIDDVEVKVRSVQNNSPLEDLVVKFIPKNHREAVVEATTNSEGIASPESLIADTYDIQVSCPEKYEEVPYYEENTFTNVIINNTSQHKFEYLIDASLIPKVILKLLNKITGEAVKNANITTEGVTVVTNSNGEAEFENCLRHGYEYQFSIDCPLYKAQVIYDTVFLDDYLITYEMGGRVISDYKIICCNSRTGESLKEINVTAKNDLIELTNRTDNNGEAVFKNVLTEGEEVLITCENDYYHKVEETIVPSFNEAEHTFYLEQAGIDFRVYVENTDEEAVENAVVTVKNSNGVMTTQKTSSGGFAFFENILSDTQAQISITHDDYYPINRNIEIMAFCGFNFTLEPNDCSLTVNVTGEGGYPIGESIVTITEEELNTTYTETTDINGNANFKQIRAGTYNITAENTKCLTGYSEITVNKGADGYKAIALVVNVGSLALIGTLTDPYLELERQIPGVNFHIVDKDYISDDQCIAFVRDLPVNYTYHIRASVQYRSHFYQTTEDVRVEAGGVKYVHINMGVLQ